MELLRYLFDLCKRNPHVVFREVESATHVMRGDQAPQVLERYFATMFG